MEELEPTGYDNAKSSIAFLRALGLRIPALRRALRDLRSLGDQGEKIIQAATQDQPLSHFIVRASHLVMLCSMIEGSLMDLANANCSTEGFKIKPEDLRGSSLEKVQAYFKKVAGLRFPDKTDAWCKLKALFTLRNAVVHALGKLTNEKKRSQVATLQGVTISQTGEIWLETDVIRSAVDIADSFVTELEESFGGPQI